MPKGRAYAADPWDSHQKGSQTFATDDFVHQNTFAFKAKLEKDNDGVNIKETVTEKAEGLSGSGEVKFWCKLRGSQSFYGKFGSSSNTQLLLDSGIKQRKDVSASFFAGLETNRNLTETAYNVGGEFFQKNKWAVGARWRFNLAKKVSVVDNKLSWSQCNWKVSSVSSVDLINRLLAKSSLLVSRTHREEDKCKCDWFLRLEGARQPGKLSIDQVVENVFLSCTEQVSENQKAGIELRLQSKNIGQFLRQPWKGVDSFWLTSEWKWGCTTLKARVNTELTHAIMIKNKLGSWGSYSLGVEGSELGTKNRCRFGMQLDLNL